MTIPTPTPPASGPEIVHRSRDGFRTLCGINMIRAAEIPRYAILDASRVTCPGCLDAMKDPLALRRGLPRAGAPA